MFTYDAEKKSYCILSGGIIYLMRCIDNFNDHFHQEWALQNLSRFFNVHVSNSALEMSCLPKIYKITYLMNSVQKHFIEYTEVTTMKQI